MNQKSPSTWRTNSWACLWLTLLVGCSEENPPATGAGPRDGAVGEFEKVAERIEASSNPYLGRAQLARLEAQLAAVPEGEIGGRVQTHLQLCFEQLRIGEPGKALEQIELAINLHGGDFTPSALLKAKAMTLLRLAEVENCIARHQAECCVFPLAGAGIHSEQGPASEAKSLLLQILQSEPDNLLVQWLLNLSCMALGEFPLGVPEEFRIPENALVTSPEVRIGRFVDVAPDLGVDAFNLCGGAIIDDFDGDGWLDIATSTSDPRGALQVFRNRGDGGFDPRVIEGQLGGLNCLAADYDNDGDLDILVLRGAWLEEQGQIRNSLLRNDGAGNFSDVTRAAGLGEHARPSQAAVWGDFDNDGDLDLFVGNESRIERTGSNLGNYPSQFFRNDGDGTFSDATAHAGLTNDRFCKGAAAGDYDNDGDLDLYVSNVGANRLYRNDGGLEFIDVAAELGVTEPGGYSFACWFFDHNNDGWLDLFVGAFEATPGDLLADYRGLPNSAQSPRLYLNRGDGTFRNAAREAGLQHVYLPMGANFADLDNDGWLDLYLATGDPSYETLMPNVLLKNIGGERYADATFASGLGHLQKGHGVAFGDLDHDGDLDLYNQLGGFYPGDRFHNALFLNPGAPSNHFIEVELVGKASNRNGIGARLRVELEGGLTLHRAIGCVSSFGGSPLSRAHVGLGEDEKILRLSIDWPCSDGVQEILAPPADGAIRIIEGKAGFSRVERKQISLDR